MKLTNSEFAEGWQKQIEIERNQIWGYNLLGTWKYNFYQDSEEKESEDHVSSNQTQQICDYHH